MNQKNEAANIIEFDGGNKTKICSSCRQRKPLERFAKDRGKKDGHSYLCLSCNAKRARKWIVENPKRHYKHTRKYNQEHPNINRNYYLKSLYGITIEEYNEMFNAQGGCCAICGIHQQELSKRLSVDHCHETNRVRGLLCSNCNSAIGLFMDSLEVLKCAASYLEDNTDEST